MCEKICWECKNLGYGSWWWRIFYGGVRWCKVLRHPIENGIAATFHAKSCKSFKNRAL